MIGKYIILGIYLFVSAAFAKEGDRVELGKLQTGATFSFIYSAESKWGIEISGGRSPSLRQQKPAQIELFQNEDNILKLAAGYKSVRKTSSYIDAYTEIAYDDRIVFRVDDRWSLNGEGVSVKRKVEIDGNIPGGFNSSIVLSVDPSIRWSDVNCLVPGALYGNPAYNGERSICGTLNNSAHRFFIREDMLPAPMVALSFSNGTSIAVLDPSPRGESTVEETKLSKDIMIDDRFQFGMLGIWQRDENPIEFGFQFPATVSIYPFGPNASAEPRWIRRFHPIAQGVIHNYEVNFRFGQNESFSEVTRNSWRWTWSTLKPEINPIDVELVRRVLIDHLADQADTIDGRTGIPFAVATFDTNQLQWNRTMTAMGFVSKNIECADQLLREGDRDSSGRGRKMRKIGLDIISSMIRALSSIPLLATGYDLATGKPWTGERQEWLAPWLRNATEDMRVLMRAYRRERSLGRQHPEWFNWVKSYVDWLILQQREDGSFPRRWKPGSSEIEEPTGTTSYCPVPLLVILAEETNDRKYLQSAVRAADYIWENFGKWGYYVGGASDNPNITDKEAGMLSIEAFLSLYESTKESKWLEHAAAAADYTETWIWIWNLPMPLDADNSKLHWKKGVPTIGLQGITARGVGGADEYLDWSTSSYAKLYKYTKDKHYLDVARILLHATKSMVALPGRQYDLKGIGWQQEGWSMGPGRNGRGVGGHRFWLPWVSANHLYSITGLEELDPALFQQLSKGN
ncbi:MAG TPA: hypothetical protein VMT35_15230 [Ignavibacteriaceae bacterium]|nr:hypothetical protein [Ignavibacteriaceae bacterium]